MGGEAVFELRYGLVEYVVFLREALYALTLGIGSRCNNLELTSEGFDIFSYLLNLLAKFSFSIDAYTFEALYHKAHKPPPCVFIGFML